MRRRLLPMALAIIAALSAHPAMAQHNYFNQKVQKNQVGTLLPQLQPRKLLRAAAADPVTKPTTGKAGDNITWTYDPATTTLTMTGTGAMYNYNQVPEWLGAYQADITKVVISDGITFIGAYTLFGMPNLTTVELPASVKKLSYMALHDNPKLANINLDNIESIGFNALANTAIYNSQPDGLVYFGSVLYCFKGDFTPDMAIEIKEGTTYITPYALVYADAEGYIDYNTFITSIKLPSTLVEIDDYAIYAISNLTDIILPPSVTTLGEGVLGDCEALANITFSENITEVGIGAIENTAYFNALPDGMVRIGKVISTYKGEFPANTTLAIPEGIEAIAIDAFVKLDQDNYPIRNENVVAVTLPESLKRIGSGAFFDLVAVTELVIPANVEYIGIQAFGYMPLAKVDVKAVTPPTIDESTFEGIPVSTQFTIPAGSEEAYRSAPHWKNFFSDVASGVYQHLTWEYNKVTKVFTITGEGAVPRNNYAMPWSQFVPVIESIVISEGISSVEYRVFADLPALKSVSLPSSMINVYNQAFNGCPNLETVNLPESLDYVGYNAFGGSKFIDAMPDGFIYLGKTLYGHKGTFPEDVIVKEGTRYINTGAFTYFQSDGSANYNEVVKSITFPESLVSIESEAFFGCHLVHEIVIPANVNYIGNEAFEFMQLDRIEMKNSVPAQIENNTFSNGTDQFTNFVVPAGSEAAYLAHDLWKQYFNDIVSGTDKGINWAFSKSAKKLSLSGTGDMNVYASPEETPWFRLRNFGVDSLDVAKGITNIGQYAFANIATLRSATIAEGVLGFGEYAFAGCSALADIKIPTTLTTCFRNSLDGTAFIKDMPDGPVIFNGTKFYMYKNMPENLECVVPEGVTHILNQAFANYNDSIQPQPNLISVVLPSTLVEIGSSAFTDCVNLQRITLNAVEPPVLRSADVFSGISENAVCVVPDASYEKYLADSDWHDLVLRTIDGTYGTNLKWVIDKPSALLTISGEGEMMNFFEEADRPAWRNYPQFVNKVVISDGVTTVCDDAFNDLLMKEVVLPDSLTTIGERAFRGCKNLTTMNVPAGLERVKDHAFDLVPYILNMPENKPVYLGKTLYSFVVNDPEFKVAEIKEGIVYIASEAMDSGTYTGLKLPESLSVIGSNAFRGADELASVTLPAGVTEIGENAFNGCTGLTEIKSLSTTPPMVYSGTFLNVDRNIPVLVPAEAVAAYKAADVWKDFSNIKALNDDPVAVDGVAAAELSAYSVDGRIIISAPAGESYLVVSANGLVVAQGVTSAQEISLPQLPSGVYFVRCAGSILKLAL